MRAFVLFWAAVVVPTAFSQTTNVGRSVARPTPVASPTPTLCLPSSPTSCHVVLKRKALVRNIVMGRMETVQKSPPTLSVQASGVNSNVQATPTAVSTTSLPTSTVPPLLTPVTNNLPTVPTDEPSRVVSPRRQTTRPTDDASETTTSEESGFSLPPLSLVAGLGGLAGLAAVVTIGATAIYLVRRKKDTPPPFGLNNGYQSPSPTSRSTTAERPPRRNRSNLEKHKDLRMNTAKAIFFPEFARKMLRPKQRLASLPVVSQPEEPIPEPYLKPLVVNEDSWVTYMDHLYRRSQARFSLRAFGGTSSGSGAVGRPRSGGDGKALAADDQGNGSEGSQPLDVLVPPLTSPREPHIRSPIRGNFEEFGSTSMNGEREEIVDDGVSESTATTILYRPNNDPWSSYHYGTEDTAARHRIADGVPRYGGEMWDSSNVGTIRNGQSSRFPGSEAPPAHNGLQGNFAPPANQQNNINVPINNERERIANNGNPFANLREHHAPIERETNRPSVFSLITTSSFDTESFVSMSDYNRDNGQSFIPGASRLDH